MKYDEVKETKFQEPPKKKTPKPNAILPSTEKRTNRPSLSKFDSARKLNKAPSSKKIKDESNVRKNVDGGCKNVENDLWGNTPGKKIKLRAFKAANKPSQLYRLK